MATVDAGTDPVTRTRLPGSFQAAVTGCQKEISDGPASKAVSSLDEGLDMGLLHVWPEEDFPAGPGLDQGEPGRVR